MIQQGSLPAKVRADTALAAERGLTQMEKIGKMDLFEDHDPNDLQVTTTSLRKQLTEALKDATEDASPLARLPVERRAMYEEMFALIYECSVNRVAAKSLVDRILLRVS